MKPNFISYVLYIENTSIYNLFMGIFNHTITTWESIGATETKSTFYINM